MRALASPYNCIFVVHIVAVRMLHQHWPPPTTVYWSCILQLSECYASIGLPLQLYIGAADCSCQNATPGFVSLYNCILVVHIVAVRMLRQDWSPPTTVYWWCTLQLSECGALRAFASSYNCILVECFVAVRMLCEHWPPPTTILVVHIVAVRMLCEHWPPPTTVYWSCRLQLSECYASIGLPIFLYIGGPHCSCQNVEFCKHWPPPTTVYWSCRLQLSECYASIGLPLLLYIGGMYWSCQNAMRALVSLTTVYWSGTLQLSEWCVSAAQLEECPVVNVIFSCPLVPFSLLSAHLPAQRNTQVLC